MEITSAQKQKIKEVAKKYQLKLLLLFGSQVSKEIHKESDVDLAFLSEKDLSFDEEILLNTEFCGLFKTDKVDTVNLKRAHSLLLKEIIDNCQILYQKKPIFYSILEALALQKYSETEPLFKIREEILREKIKSYDR